jgi:hypothetical protein
MSCTDKRRKEIERGRKKERERERERDREKERERENGQYGEPGHLHLHLPLAVLIFNCTLSSYEQTTISEAQKKGKNTFFRISAITHRKI